jgi:DNA (cytosine-5)-methyltransferase 1
VEIGVVRLLDLFCGAGGAAKGYADAGFEVVGVDISPQPNYPYVFVRADALNFEWRSGDYDAVHASPPCQVFSAYRRKDPSTIGVGYRDLIAATRECLYNADLPFVIENVVGAPLESPAMLCGSSFGLDVRRHRLFETNWPLTTPPCNHAWQTPRFPSATNRLNPRCTIEVGAWRCADIAPAAMEVNWMTNAELSQSLPPEYTRFIGRQLAGYLRARLALSVG